MFRILRESVLMALDALMAHKVRSALTLAGVLIGVFSVLVVMTTMRIMQKDMERELSQLGTHTFQVQKLPSGNIERSKMAIYRRRKDITYSQVIAVQENPRLAGNVGALAMVYYGEVISQRGKTNPNIYLFGANPETFGAKNWSIAEGRGLNAADLDAERHVCVIGDRVARKVFPEMSPVGETVKFDGIHYRVVGVLEPKGEMFGEPQDNLVAIPITTALKRYGLRHDLAMLVQAHDRENYEELATELRGTLRKIRNVLPADADDFEIFSNDSLMNHFLARTKSYRIGAFIIGSIALFSAGIGIMNIMLVSVTERTKEIGVRRAIGARRRSILVQFVTEAVVTCQIGGIAGIVLGVLVGNIGAHHVLRMPPAIPYDWALIGLTICCLVGVVFGTYPALKAASVDPVVALRYE